MNSLSTAVQLSSAARAHLHTIRRLEVELDRFHPAEREDPDHKVQDPDEPGQRVQEEHSDGVVELALNVLPLDMVLCGSAALTITVDAVIYVHVALSLRRLISTRVQECDLQCCCCGNARCCFCGNQRSHGGSRAASAGAGVAPKTTLLSEVERLGQDGLLDFPRIGVEGRERPGSRRRTDCAAENAGARG